MTKKSVSQKFSRKDIFELAKAYSTGTYTHANFERQYNSKSHVFYSLLHIAVDKCIVNDQIASKIAEVAASSSREKVLQITGNPTSASHAYARVFRSWQERIKKRHSFQFSKKDAKIITTQYAKNGLNKEEFCKRNYMSKELFDSTLKSAIIFGWVSDAIVQKLFEKSQELYGTEKATKFFDILKQKRSENVKNKRQ